MRFCRFVFFLSFLVSTSAFPAPFSCRAWFGNQKSKVSEVLRRNRFDTSRGLREYESQLPSAFSVSLNELRSQDIWMDLGGGKGFALEDYLKQNKGAIQRAIAHTILVTYSLPRIFGISDYGGKLKVLKGRLFEEIPDAEIPRARLMTDVMGVLSYTKDLSTALTKIFDHLVVEGNLFVSESSTALVIETPQGNLNLISFLRQIPGLEVLGHPGSFRVIKKQEKIVIPKLQLIKINETERPFFRRFSLVQ